MKTTKTGLILVSAVLSGSLFAQQPQPKPPGGGPLPGQPGPAPGSFGGGGPKPGPGLGLGVGGGGGGATGHRLATMVQRNPDGDRMMMGMPFDEPSKRTLIIATSKLDEASRENIQEDMQIMSLVLDKAAERALDNAQDRPMGIVVKTFPGVQGQNIYMEDYGPLFIINVPIPLTGPKTAEGADQPPVDSDWEQAKRELSQKRPFGTFEPLKYDPKKVEALKTNLLEALKNATNIRRLKPDQSITIAVNGGGHPRTVITKQLAQKPTPKEESPDRSVAHVRQMSDSKGLGGQPATLTIRVKKSDVDAFAKGKISLEEFTRKATVSSN